MKYTENIQNETDRNMTSSLYAPIRPQQMRYKRLYHFRHITTLNTTLNSVRCDLKAFAIAPHTALYRKKPNDLSQAVRFKTILGKNYNQFTN